MKIFLICPVREADNDQIKKLNQYVKEQEQLGNSIYYPARDTDQNDTVGYRICTDNRGAILNADEIHIFFDANSKGSLFDLGMAFSLNKPLCIVNRDELQRMETKSFTNMIIEWAQL